MKGAILTLAILVLAPNMCNAHSFYSAFCCTGEDCAPVPAGTVIAKAAGWHVDLNKVDHPLVTAPYQAVIPYGDSALRESPDMNFHVCISPYTRVVRCLYVPGAGA
jgi:hypothetical protein